MGVANYTKSYVELVGGGAISLVVQWDTAEDCGEEVCQDAKEE